jgi:type I restriction enzyme S subunit
MAKKAVNQASINQTELGRVKVIVPPMKEQMRIVAVLSCVDLAIQKTDEVIAKAERLKKGLMQKLLTEGIGHKEFKDTEIGKMPNSWEAVKMKTVCPQIVGGVAIKTSDFQESGFQVLSKGDIKEFGQLILDKKQKKFVSQKFASKFPSQIVGFDDTVIALRDLSTAMDFLGLAANITVDQQYLVAQGVGILKLERRKVLPAFITNLSNSDRYRTFIKRKGVGSTQVHMRPHELLAFILGLPSLNEQREIVDRFSLVDRKLQIEKKTKAKLERIKQNLMETLLTGKIRVKVD